MKLIIILVVCFIFQSLQTGVNCSNLVNTLDESYDYETETSGLVGEPCEGKKICYYTCECGKALTLHVDVKTSSGKLIYPEFVERYNQKCSNKKHQKISEVISKFIDQKSDVKKEERKENFGSMSERERKVSTMYIVAHRKLKNSLKRFAENIERLCESGAIT